MRVATQNCIIELAEAGNPPSVLRGMIDEDVGIHEIYYVIKCARKAGIDIPRFERGVPRKQRETKTLTVPAEVFEALRPVAEHRQHSVSSFCALLLQKIAADDLFNAILDEGVRMSMAADILRILQKSTDALSKAQIAEQLELVRGTDLTSRHALNHLGEELFAMANAGMIAFDLPNAARPEFSFYLRSSGEAVAHRTVPGSAS